MPRLPFASACALAALFFVPAACDPSAHADKKAEDSTKGETLAGPAANGVRPDPEVDLSLIPQAGAVTVEAKDALLEEVVQTISKQAGWPVDCGGFDGKEKRVSLSVKNVPFLGALGELCRQNRWSFGEYQDGEGGRSFRIETHEVKDPIVAYQVHGPLMLTWHGLSTLTSFNFDDPQKPLKITKYRLGYFSDPRACLEVGSEQGPVRDIPVTFTLGGRDAVLQSDHNPTTFESGVPAWQFPPEKFSAPPAALRVAVPFLAPTRVSTTQLSWAETAKHEAEGVHVALSKLQSESKKVMNRADPFKEDAVVEWTAELKVIHSQAASNKLPPNEMILEVRDATVTGQGGSAVPGKVTQADGISGPEYGYGYRLRFQSKDQAFRPAKVQISWVSGYRPTERIFELKDLPPPR